MTGTGASVALWYTSFSMITPLGFKLWHYNRSTCLTLERIYSRYNTVRKIIHSD